VNSTTEQIVSALRVLSVEIHSEDGVANAVVAEAADRLTLMANLVAKHVQETKEDVEQMAVASETMVEATAKIQNLRARIKRLEEALESIREYWNRDNNNRAMVDACWYAIDTASEALEAKEAKP
jgi:methyl-accepting chemotaxis protein